MATTFNFELNNKASKKNLYTVMLRVTHNRKIKRTNTLVALSNLNHWDKKKQRVKSLVPNYKKLNSMLDDEIERAKREYIELRNDNQANAENIVNALNGKHSASFVSFISDEIVKMTKSGHIGNAKTYNHLLVKIEGYLETKRKTDLSFSDITPNLILSFTEYLKTTTNTRVKEVRLHPNTIVKILSRFRAVYNKAKVLKLFPRMDDPFEQVSFATVTTVKEKLNQKEVQKIIDLEIEEQSLMWHCRNTFLFSMYCAGIRISDLLQLRWNNIDNGRITYSMSKNHKNRDLILIPQAMQIINLYIDIPHKPDDYIFPFLENSAKYAKYNTFTSRETMPVNVLAILRNKISTETALINKYLKIIRKQCEINKSISNHIARHTFAKLAKEAGTDNLAVKGLLAHSSVSTTERYMGSFSNEQEDTALINVFNCTKNTKILLDRCKTLSEDEALKVLTFIDTMK